MSTTQRPFSFSPAPIDPVSPSSAAMAGKKRPLSLQTSNRQPLGVISVQSFQDRHRTQFAHLHQHSDDSLREKRLEAEKAELEAARRLGKEKRESVKISKEGKGGMDKKNGRRPLSLVVKQSGSLGRSAGTYGQGQGVRPNSLPLHTRAKSDAGLLSPRASTNARARHSNGLNVVVESDHQSKRSETPSSYDHEISPDVSIAQSSYSWASQFSGETEELRTAARYVPRSGSDAGEDDEAGQEEELLDDEDEDEVYHTPEDGTVRRRKKIVALAHTVRQLEGVGSREAEDPAFYDTLVKAWNDRPVVGVAPHHQQLQSPMTDNGSSQSPLPFTPNLSSRHSEGYPAFSDTSFDRDGMSMSTKRSNSLRYSYASTLHDLAIEGGIEQANRIFLAKPWLRGSIIASSSTAAGGGGAQEFLNPPPLASGAGDAEGDMRRLSFASPPALAPPDDFASSPNGPGLRHAKKTLGSDLPHAQASSPGPIDFTASPEPSPAISDEGQALLEDQAPAPPTDSSSQGWGLGFVNNWFGTAPAPVAESDAAATDLPRSTTLAQFDDAPNDPSLDEDAEGESDPEFDTETEQDFHDAGEGVGLTNTNDLDPSMLGTVTGNEVQTEVTTETDTQAESAVLLTRPESSVLPITPDLELTPSISTEPENTSIDSLSSNHYPQPPYSTHSITSYHQPLLAAATAKVNLNLSSVPSPTSRGMVEYQNHEIRSARGSCHSSDSCSSPSTSSVPATGRRGSRPSLTPIITGLTTVEEPTEYENREEMELKVRNPSPSQLEEEITPTDTETKVDQGANTELIKNLRDERFSSAFKLAQSLNIPTPTIKSPVRTSSINPNLHTSVLSLLSPTQDEMEEDMIQSHSNHSYSQDLSDDAELTMMGGGGALLPVRARPRSASVSTSISARGSMVSPGPMSPSGSARLAVPSARSLRRPSLIELRTQSSRNTLSSISELNVGPRLMGHSGTAYSISEGSEHLVEVDGESEYDLESPSELPYSPGFSSSSISLSPSSPGPTGRFGRLSRLAPPSPSLDSLRPPSMSDSRSQFTMSMSELGLGRERPTSKYQAYQAHQIEMSRRANARVAAKMAGATPKELKALEVAQRSPCPEEKGETIIIPKPSMVACAFFFIGILGPWFWIIGGWWPLGHSSEIKHANEEAGDGESIMLDYSGAENSWRGWKWTYHPDPWVKRNRRAAAIAIPLLVIGGVAAAIVVALTMG